MDAIQRIFADAACIVTTRDHANRPIKRVLYERDDRVIRRVLLFYDAAGLLIEEGEAESGNRLRDDARNRYRCV